MTEEPDMVKQYKTILKILGMMDNPEAKEDMKLLIDTIKDLMQSLIDTMKPIFNIFQNIIESLPEDLIELMKELKEMENDRREE